MAAQMLVVQADVDVRRDADAALVALREHVAEHIALHAGVRDADLRRIVGKAEVALGEHIDKGHMGVRKALGERGGVPVPVEIINSGHRMEIEVYRAFDRGHRLLPSFFAQAFIILLHYTIFPEEVNRLLYIFTAFFAVLPGIRRPSAQKNPPERRFRGISGGFYAVCQTFSCRKAPIARSAVWSAGMLTPRVSPSDDAAIAAATPAA